MDVNGTKYHLLYGPGDWGSCWSVSTGTVATLSDLWSAEVEADLEWDATSQDLRLTSIVPLFRRAGRLQVPLDIGLRRGAGRDRYGNWYWIDAAEGGIRFLAAGTRQSSEFWTPADRPRECVPTVFQFFVTCSPAPPETLLLRGLAVTTHHFLVVGDVSEHGLLIFDLHRGGAPTLLRWPDDIPFTPWDIAATPDGGVLILDRDHRVYWLLDADFRLPADVTAGEKTTFQPADPGQPRSVLPPVTHPAGIPLTGGVGQAPTSPISIEPGPDGTVLILDTEPTRPYSLVYQYVGATLETVYSLQDAVEAEDPALGEGVIELFSVMGQDFAYLPPTTEQQGEEEDCGCGTSQAATPSPQSPLLYVAERDGKQAMAFVLDRVHGKLVDQKQYVPLRRWEGKGLVHAGSRVYYDFADRWIPLEPFVECHYAGRAQITTPIPGAADTLASPIASAVPGAPFDSDMPGCVWHRLFLDAQIPPGTRIGVRARASDDAHLLDASGWIQQPDLYLRSGGSEIPFYDPWSDLQGTDGRSPDGTGTWELLLQNVIGRYLQIEVTIEGTGRSTPRLRALRAWYPRFSYLNHYLPDIYKEDLLSASFFDRWLANFEGLYTNLEDKIQEIPELFDPRTAPADTLDWLACWMGIALDPLWSEDRRRFFIRHAHDLYAQRGTVPGVEIALRLYLDAHLNDSLFDPAQLGKGSIRITERFRTRGAGAYAYGAPDTRGARPLRPLTPGDVATAAHRFTVLIPSCLSLDQQAMVQRLIGLEKPAHTSFDTQWYWHLFRVGDAQLGIDTQLGRSERFVPLVLGTNALASSFLDFPYPFNIADRVVSDRDRLGGLPPL